MVRRTLSGRHPSGGDLGDDIGPVAHLGMDFVFRVHAKHDVDPQHYEEVLTEMRNRRDDKRLRRARTPSARDPRPVIRVVEWKGEYYAIEGSHRLKAAHELGIFPRFLIKHPWRVAGSDEDFWFDGVALDLPAYSWAIEWWQKDGQYVPSVRSTPA